MSVSRLVRTGPAHRRPGVVALVLLLVLALGLAACGDDDAVTTGPGGDDTRDEDGDVPEQDTEYLSVSVTEAGAERPLVSGTRIRLHFSATSVGASLGCNSMSGESVMDGDVLVVEALATTEMGCDAARHAQDEWFAGILGAGPTVRIDGDTLVLETETTRIEFLARSVADPDRPLVGTRWRVDGFIDGDVAMSMATDVDATLFLSADTSEAVGSDGCNGFTVAFEVDGDRLDFATPTFEQASCPDTVEYQERVRAVLVRDVTATIDADHLRLLAPDGRGVTFIADE